MSKPTIDDYLENGIYGQKQTKPDERRKFLGTLRERIVIALTQSQVREKGIYKEVQDQLKKHPDAKLLLNGNMSYTFLSKYIKLADTYHVSFSMVTNKEIETDIGLVLAYDHAIDQEEIFVQKKSEKVMEAKAKPKPKKSLFSSIKNKLF
ncbi:MULTISPECIES: YueI family protein [unclassified Rossellomorea]|uniref:YueI family protein n=1 Tax=unclassified Rossellomorea TaxID=2837526 RepID=UPI0020C5F60B|nr:MULTISPECIES: YueI family protein [unclassified Rossellomorea]UTE78040.1 YueI family protein [Rossellomorea sp. KS-H15a]WGG46000.1 YueI family protein [Rossellomorea sp. DA94]